MWLSQLEMLTAMETPPRKAQRELLMFISLQKLRAAILRGALLHNFYPNDACDGRRCDHDGNQHDDNHDDSHCDSSSQCDDVYGSTPNDNDDAHHVHRRRGLKQQLQVQLVVFF